MAMLDTLGKRIKHARMRLGMTQAQLGKLNEVTQSNVAQWEQDKRKPKDVIRVARTLKVDLMELLGLPASVDGMSDDGLAVGMMFDEADDRTKEMIFYLLRGASKE